MVLTQSALASQTKPALALDKSTAAPGPWSSSCEENPESCDQHPGFHSHKKPREYSVPEELGTRSLYIRTLGSSHLVVERTKEEAER